MDAHDFLKALATVLCVAAVTTVVFQRLRQPVVLGYILAGLIVGPHLPVPLIADAAVVRTLSELGVILLMFALGLEFSLRKLIRVGPTAGVTALIECALMIWLGFMAGRALGWSILESTFASAVFAISSTTIVAKVFDEQCVRGKLREIVVGVLIVEDLIAILLMATLTAVASGAGLSASGLASTAGRLAAFLIGLVVVGMLIVPRAMRGIVRLNRPETTVVASVGICFAAALLALEFGYSVALGAFLAGVLIAESGEEKVVEHLVGPVKDVFAAVFFVSVGMMLDPAIVAEYWGAILVFTGVVIAGKVVGVTVGAFLTGAGVRTSVQAGMSLAQIGEFSFIIAGLGLSLHTTREFLYPIAVSVSAITTLTTPWLIRAADPVASFVDRTLPRPLQTFVALYGSWIEELRAGSQTPSPARTVRRLVGLLALDAALLMVLIIGAAISMPRIVSFVTGRFELDETTTRLLVIAAAVTLSIPFCVGVVQLARKLGLTLAERALPRTGGRVDLAAAPRRALVVTLQLALVLLVGIPLLAITQPFVPGLPGAALLVMALIALGVTFWRSATNLQGHVRAGAEAIVEALSAQSRSGAPAAEEELSAVRAALPGLGEPSSVQLPDQSPAVGRTLAQLNLRGLTGATVLAIRRGEQALLVPTAQEQLRPGDILALAGTTEAIQSARSLLGVHGEPDREPQAALQP